MHHKLISSPLQGYTDFHFRNAFQQFFNGIDHFYAPYIRFNGKMIIKPIYERDLKLKNNPYLKVIPQVMTCSADEFIFAANYVRALGYKELNFPAAVRAGDVVSGKSIVRAKRASKSRPELGIITTHETMTNQRGETVLDFTVSFLVERREK